MCFGRGVYELDMSNMNYSCHVCTAHTPYTPLGGRLCAGGVWVCLGGGVCCGISTCEVDFVRVCDEVWGYCVGLCAGGVLVCVCVCVLFGEGCLRVGCYFTCSRRVCG